MEQTQQISSNLLINPSSNNPCRPSIVLFDDKETDVSYHAHTEIGSSCNGSVPVYAAAVKRIINYYEHHPIAHVTIKFVSCDDNQGLVFQCYENDMLAAEHPKVVGVVNRFTYDGFFCVVLPRVDTSLRAYVMSKAPRGIDETSILVVLREVLQGLSFIHSKGHVHGQINADHVYLNIGPKEIKLGYAASICDFKSSSGTAASSAIIHLPRNEWLTQRSDIWLVGVMALELAYGDLSSSRFKERRTLDAFLKRISESKRLPSMKKKKHYSACKSSGSGFCLVNMIRSIRKIDDELTDYCGRVFSRDFSNMISRCLDPDPEKRPSANDLLNSEIFRNCDDDVRDFFSILNRIHKKSG